MPKLLNNDDGQTHQTLHGFNFSAVKIEDLGASEYTIVTIVVDVSGSVGPFKNEMELTLQKIVESCKKSPRSENLLVRLVAFSDNVNEIHGFRELVTIDPAEYLNILKCYGATALMDAALNSAEATEAYGAHLSSIDYRSNGIMFVITDGQDNVSVIAKNPSVLKKAFQKIKTGEISSYHNKGMHTTTFAEMHRLSFGGFMIDTPGIKEFGLVHFESQEIAERFPEFRALLPECRYNNCTHVHEPGCAVKKALDEGRINQERYRNYLGLLNDENLDTAEYE